MFTRDPCTPRSQCGTQSWSRQRVYCRSNRCDVSVGRDTTQVTPSTESPSSQTFTESTRQEDEVHRRSTMGRPPVRPDLPGTTEMSVRTVELSLSTFRSKSTLTGVSRRDTGKVVPPESHRPEGRTVESRGSR